MCERESECWCNHANDVCIRPVCVWWRGALTFPPLYSLASCSSLLGWGISPRREMNAFWVDGVLSTCSRRSIVWFDIRAGHGTSYLAALTHMTQPVAQGDQRGSWNVLTRSAAISIWGLLFDWRSKIHLWLTFLVIKKKWWTRMTLLASCVNRKLIYACGVSD